MTSHVVFIETVGKFIKYNTKEITILYQLLIFLRRIIEANQLRLAVVCILSCLTQYNIYSY